MNVRLVEKFMFEVWTGQCIAILSLLRRQLLLQRSLNRQPLTVNISIDLAGS